jgi:hypothetical protein
MKPGEAQHRLAELRANMSRNERAEAGMAAAPGAALAFMNATMAPQDAAREAAKIEAALAGTTVDDEVEKFRKTMMTLGLSADTVAAAVENHRQRVTQQRARDTARMIELKEFAASAKPAPLYVG